MKLKEKKLTLKYKRTVESANAEQNENVVVSYPEDTAKVINGNSYNKQIFRAGQTPFYWKMTLWVSLPEKSRPVFKEQANSKSVSHSPC